MKHYYLHLSWHFADEAQEAEAKQVLHSIHDIREQAANQNPVSAAKISHALAMLYFLLHDMAKVRGKQITDLGGGGGVVHSTLEVTGVPGIFPPFGRILSFSSLYRGIGGD